MPEWPATNQQDLADTVTMLENRVADLMRLQQEDIGWRRLGESADGFTHDWLIDTADLCKVMAVANPLIKRGLGLKAGYVWGQGVTVAIDDKATVEDGSQDVNGILEAFWDDPSNRGTLSSSQAQTTLEHLLGTCGEVFLALPTTVKGRVRVRLIPQNQVQQIITNPQDEATRWYYLRHFTQHDPFTGTDTELWHAYPALGYWPKRRPGQVTVNAQPYQVQWSTPVRAVQVNMVGDRGIPDAYPALKWARMSEEFLVDWAKLMRSLSRVAWQVSTKGDKAAAAARAIAATPGVPGNSNAAGSTVAMDQGTRLEAVSKSGATIDANSGLPLQQMVATAFGVPLTMLTGDPGSTGARAVAETLDQPTEHEMGLRRELWTEVFSDIIGYVIDQAVITNQLQGSVVDDPDDHRRIVTLPDADSRDVRVDWPEWDSVSLTEQVAAIVSAETTGTLPAIEITKLLAAALGIEDIDAVVEAMTDDDGNFVSAATRDQAEFDRMQAMGAFGTPAPQDEQDNSNGE